MTETIRIQELIQDTFKIITKMNKNLTCYLFCENERIIIRMIYKEKRFDKCYDTDLLACMRSTVIDTIIVNDIYEMFHELTKLG